MSNEQLTAILAQRVMRWRVGVDRFLMNDGGWKPLWKFRPTERREDALRLLDAAKPIEYTISTLSDGGYRVRVVIGQSAGIAQDIVEPRAITYAVARAIGVEPDHREPPKTGADRE